DVFVLETYRGRGLGKWLVRCVMACPALQDVRRWSLCTTDAHSLYQQVGFRALSSPEKHMEFLRYASYAERARTGAYTDDEAAMAEDENLGGCG
ncbi:MAG: GNAT family N-acetyltransferase, partial [Anaerolineae bacterium]|nr:GNAT family N-acetyltransferase [Anaerolineae bacterium]